jgi:hypothetical protein
MTTPLSPTPSAQLNFSTPPTTRRYDKFEVRTHTATRSISENIENEEGDSSPFIAQVDDENAMNAQAGKQQEQHQDEGPQQQEQQQDKEILSPSKRRPHSRILSGTELSPLKILQQDHGHPERSSSPASLDGQLSGLTSPTVDPPNALFPPRSSRKTISPIKRFPVKVSSHHGDGEAPRVVSPVRPQERHISLDQALQENEGLKHAIEIFEDDASALDEEDKDEEDDDTVEVTAAVVTSDGAHDVPPSREHAVAEEVEEEEDATGVDDTMISTFSTFSAVPNLTMLARMRDGSVSPTKTMFGGETPTPRARNEASPPRTARPCIPGSTNNNGNRQYDSGGNTTNLMDFTEQLRFGNYPQATPSRRGRMSPTKAAANLLGSGAATIASTPQKRTGAGPSSNLVNLLDFDIPPLPTPRSIPTITPRELESLKSGFLSEISSLKATLSGKEAEVSSLKTAVGDAEKRVGECMEQLREVKGLRESLEAEKNGWEKRGRDMEDVLRRVKDEIVMGQREREELEFKLDEAEKRREAAEMMAQEAESKMAGMRAGKAAADSAMSPEKAGSGLTSPGRSTKEVEMAVERVARELHALYKSKHETKVAALKKSYENRWEKKVRELQGKVDELARENEELRVGRDATLTRVDPARLSELEQERKEEKARDSEQIAHLTAEVDKLEAMVKSVQADNGEIRTLLERERVEKGELVQLAEEMMSMQQSFVAASADDDRGAPAATATTPRAMPTERHMMAPPRPSSSGLGLATRTTPSSTRQHHLPGVRPSGLRAPGGLKPSSSESRIGRGGLGHDRTKSTTVSGVPRPGSGLAVRSGGLMSSIEKMGNYGRGRGGE